jgi:hypothetical protein
MIMGRLALITMKVICKMKKIFPMPRTPVNECSISNIDRKEKPYLYPPLGLENVSRKGTTIRICMKMLLDATVKEL